MQWFREAKFGLFIHWGLYAIPAGEWKGQPIAGIGEWIMNRAKIPAVEYAELAKQFNPVKFDADAWVQMAQDAGMKYLVITSKHHDGFAMYHSLVSPYNVYDATPWHRDPLKELAAACAHLRRRRAGPFGAAPELKILAAMARGGFSQDIARRALRLSRDEAEVLIKRLHE